MRTRVQGSLTRRWYPERLWQSLPIAHGLGLSRLAGFLVGVGMLLMVVSTGYGVYYPEDVAELSGDAQKAEALAALAQVQLPVWDPGGSLGSRLLPERMPTPTAPFWTARDPTRQRPEGSDHGEAVAAFNAGDFESASYSFDQAAKTSGLWEPRYNQGISLYRYGVPGRALRVLEQARNLLEGQRYGPYSGDPDYLAAWIVTRYAISEVRGAHAPDECLAPIRDLKQAVGRLVRFVDAGGARTIGREVPFRLAPTELNSYDVWIRLNELYHACDAYPRDYFPNYGSKKYRSQNSARPDLGQNRNGLFPERAKECWDRDGDTERDCWWRINYNHLHFQSREIVEVLNPRASSNWPALARLYQHLALALATDGNIEQAQKIFASARRLVAAAPFQREDREQWQQSLEDLGLYLASSADEGSAERYASLAEPYRDKSIGELGLSEATDSQLKGMAQALTERWQGQIKDLQPDAMAQEIAAARDTIDAGRYKSLNDWWAGEAQPAMRQKLAETIQEERERNAAGAMAIRDFRMEYLGNSWRWQAIWAWFKPAMLRLVGLIVLGLVVLGIWWLLHRFVVYPYLLYSRNYYQQEFTRRYAERLKEGLPFIGPELEEERNRLRQSKQV